MANFIELKVKDGETPNVESEMRSSFTPLYEAWVQKAEAKFEGSGDFPTLLYMIGFIDDETDLLLFDLAVGANMYEGRKRGEKYYARIGGSVGLNEHSGTYFPRNYQEGSPDLDGDTLDIDNATSADDIPLADEIISQCADIVKALYSKIA